MSPRPGSIPSDIRDALAKRRSAASIEEIVEAINKVRRFPVPTHSVRSALSEHTGNRGARLFVSEKRGRYALRKPS